MGTVTIKARKTGLSAVVGRMHPVDGLADTTIQMCLDTRKAMMYVIGSTSDAQHDKLIKL